MKRIAFIAATGFLALALTACGESSNKQPTASTTTETTTTQQPAPAQQPAGNQTPNQ